MRVDGRTVVWPNGAELDPDVLILLELAQVRLDSMSDLTYHVVDEPNDAVVLVEVFSKKAAATPRAFIDACKRRLREYDNA
ncbi:MAG: hypothetical protein ACT4P5_02605 [Armatimonadota bacterium]